MVVRMSPEQLESIQRRLDFLRIEAGDIPRFATMSQQDYVTDRDRRRSLERMVENIVNASVDIARIVLSAGDLPVPDSYRESMLQLGMSGVLPQELANRLAEMTRLRNVLAHQYLDIRWASLRTFLDEAAPFLEQFMQCIERLLEDSAPPGP
ncbi:MAG TPA: DUF86 domain-containing protein [Firmicutes bacterium]|nr:DUF86 domain-containing protein [Bacillota bacterium]